MTICADKHPRRGLASIDTHSQGFYIWMHELISSSFHSGIRPLFVSAVLLAGAAQEATGVIEDAVGVAILLGIFALHTMALRPRGQKVGAVGFGQRVQRSRANGGRAQ